MKTLILLLIVPLLSLGQTNIGLVGLSAFEAQNEGYYNTYGLDVFLLDLDSNWGVYTTIRSAFDSMPLGEEVFDGVIIGGFPGDVYLGEVEGPYTQISFGALKGLASNKLFGYAGCGVNFTTKYAQWFGDGYLYGIGPDGHYYYNLYKYKFSLNASIGVFCLVAKTIGLKLGYEFNPEGLTAGVSVKWNPKKRKRK